MTAEKVIQLLKTDHNPNNGGNSNYGWIIVCVCFITLALAYGAAWYSFSVFLVALSTEFNWNRSLIAGAFSVFMLIHGIVGPFAGSMVDRYGPKLVFLIGALALGVGFYLSSFIDSSWQLYISFGLVTALGVGLIGWVPNTTVIQQWFMEKRGLPIGIISSGVGIGIFLCVPLVQYLINQVGWRITYRAMAFIIPLIIVFLVVSFVKKPQKVMASNITENKTKGNVIKEQRFLMQEWSERSWTVKRAAETRQFWLLGASFFLTSFTTHSILTHHVAFFIEQGLNALSASYIAGMIGVVSIGAKIFWGLLSDRIGREISYTFGTGCSIFGLILLIAFYALNLSYMPYLYAILFGLGYAAGAALPPLIAADLFQGKAYGGIFGTLMMLNNVGGACGSWFAGLIYDKMKNYVPAFLIMIFCSLLAVISIWMAAPRKIKFLPIASDKP